MILFAAKKNLVMDLYDLLDTNFTLDFEMIGWSFLIFISQ